MYLQRSMYEVSDLFRVNIKLHYDDVWQLHTMTYKCSNNLRMCRYLRGWNGSYIYNETVVIVLWCWKEFMMGYVCTQRHISKM